jgi:hypothetical protein
MNEHVDPLIIRNYKRYKANLVSCITLKTKTLMTSKPSLSSSRILLVVVVLLLFQKQIQPFSSNLQISCSPLYINGNRVSSWCSFHSHLTVAQNLALDYEMFSEGKLSYFCNNRSTYTSLVAIRTFTKDAYLNNLFDKIDEHIPLKNMLIRSDTYLAAAFVSGEIIMFRTKPDLIYSVSPKFVTGNKTRLFFEMLSPSVLASIVQTGTDTFF